MTDKKLPTDVENRWNDAHPQLVGLAVAEFEKRFLAKELAIARAEERERSAKVSYDKMSQEIVPFTPKIFSTITSTEGKWE